MRWEKWMGERERLRGKRKIKREEKEVCESRRGKTAGGRAERAEEKD
jgi:hypothetical protein